VKAIKAVIVSIILMTTISFAQRPPICDVNCGPDPGSGTYFSNVGARVKRQNARGHSNPMVPRQAIITSSSGGATQELPGSQSFNWSIPLVNLSGRAGLDVTLSLIYNSRIWDFNSADNNITFNIDRDFPSYGFRMDYGYLENDTTDGFWILTEGDGSKHQMNSTSTNLWDSIDSTFIELNSSTMVISYRDGRQISYQVFPNLPTGSNPLYRPVQITDTNGNYISISYVAGSDVVSNQRISAITDSLGRVINFNYNSSGQLLTITQGSAPSIFTYATFVWSSVPFNYNFSGLTVTDTQASGTSINVLTQCTLPDGTYYTFSYGDWGIINRIDHFSKTSIRRSYESYNFPTAATTLSDVPSYTQQTVSPDGTTQYLWGYSTTKSGDIVSSQSITDPSNTITIININMMDPCSGTPSSIIVKSGSTTLRTVNNTWTADSLGNNCQITSATTVLNDSGQQFTNTYAYDANGNLIDEVDKDFDRTVLREVVTSYLSPTSNHILNLVSSVVIKDAGGTKRSRTDYAYDTTTLTTVSGAVHNTGSSPARGNMTSLTRYINAQAGTGAIVRTSNFDSLGNVILAQLDCCNQKAWVYSATTQYAYPDSVTRGTSPLTLTTSTTYDFDTGLVLTSTDENNQVVQFQYDAAHRLNSASLPNGTILYTDYDDTAGLATITSRNNVNSFRQVTSIDGLDRTVKQQTMNGASTVISNVDTTYDGLGHATSVTNPYAPGDTIYTTSTTYDALGRASQMSPPSGGFYQYAYSGNATTTTDPANKQIRRFADALARLIEVDEPAYGSLPGTGSVSISGAEGSKTTFSPPPKCPPRVICDSGDPTVITVYDTGRVSATINDMQYSVSYGQNDTSVTIAANLASAMNNDPSRLVNASASSSTVNLVAIATGVGTNYSLSVSSVTTSSSFAAGTTSFPITASGAALTGGSDPAVSLKTPAVTTYSYRPTGELTQVISGSQTRTFVYDDLGRSISTTLPESGTTQYTYFDFGGVQARTDARGVTTTYSYDGLNRLHQTSYNVGSTGVPAGSTITLNYGTSTASFNNGRLIQMTDGSGSESYTYDLMGNVTGMTKVINGTSFPFTYSYNGLSAFTQVTYPSGRVVGQAYDAIGRLQGITNAGSNALSVNTYNAAGQVLSLNYGNSVAGGFAYNDHSKLSTINYVKGANTLLNLTYSYGTQNNGEINSIIDSRGSAYNQSLSYDPLARLTSAQTSDLMSANTWCLNWSFDRNNNRLSQSGCGGTLSTGQPQLTIDPTTNRITSSGFVYDADGNLTNDGIHTYTYDVENRIVQVDGGATATYSYDGNGLRVMKGTTIYVRSGAQVAAEYSGGAVQREYVYSPDGILICSISGGSTTYYQRDHLSNRLLTDATGAAIGTSGDLPFGDSWYNTQPSDKWKFATYERDSETGLDYAIARYYSTRLGRFMSPDPLGGAPESPQSLNRYTYSRNDPVNLVDPLGLTIVTATVCSYGMVTVQYGPDDDPSFEQEMALVCEETLIDVPDGPPEPPPDNPPIPDNPCNQKIINAINNKLGTNLTVNNITNAGAQNNTQGRGSQWNIDVAASSANDGLTANQFNAIQPNTHFPMSTTAAVLGWGSTLHIAGTGTFQHFFDPGAQFSSSNVGGQLSVSFTAHLDSANGGNPLGAIMHFFRDVLFHKHRNPCP